MSIAPDFTAKATELLRIVQLDRLSHDDAVVLIRAQLATAFLDGGMKAIEMMHEGLDKIGKVA